MGLSTDSLDIQGVQKMKLFSKVKIKHIVVVTILVSVLMVVHMSGAFTAEPGTDANPLVTQDYVDAKINALTATVNSLSQQLQNVQQPAASKFVPIEVEGGKQVIAGEGTEIILRGGKASCITSAGGGLSDVTAGTEISSAGDEIPLNHLLVVSRDDGRGLKTEVKAWLLIKGPYTIK